MTLHWFVHPQWFDDLGGWTEAKNIRHFVDWAELAFKHFGRLHMALNSDAPAYCNWFDGCMLLFSCVDLVWIVKDGQYKIHDFTGQNFPVCC